MWIDPSSPISRVLEPSEELLWTGQPRQGIVFQPSDLWLFPFAVLWFGFAWILANNAEASSAPFLIRLAVAFLIVTGLYVTIARFFVEAKIRARTFYAVTNRRCLIVGGLIWRRSRSTELKTLHTSRSQNSLTTAARSRSALWSRSVAGRHPNTGPSPGGRHPSK